MCPSSGEACCEFKRTGTVRADRRLGLRGKGTAPGGPPAFSAAITGTAAEEERGRVSGAATRAWGQRGPRLPRGLGNSEAEGAAPRGARCEGKMGRSGGWRGPGGLSLRLARGRPPPAGHRARPARGRLGGAGSAPRAVHPLSAEGAAPAPPASRERPRPAPFPLRRPRPDPHPPAPRPLRDPPPPPGPARGQLPAWAVGGASGGVTRPARPIGARLGVEPAPGGCRQCGWARAEDASGRCREPWSAWSSGSETLSGAAGRAP